VTGRALLLGCPDPGLRGVASDLEVMTRLVMRHGFTDIVTLYRGARVAILAALDALVARTAAGDAVVVFYSGHGWRVDLPQGRGGPRDFQGIAPADLHATTLNDFRGVLADELSARIDELTARTANVTTIFDCCHATDISRSPTDVPVDVRVLPVPWTIPPAALFARLAEMGLARPRRDSENNPSAVQLLACRPHQEAGEDPTAPGGLLTRALDAVLAEPGASVFTWEDVVRRIDARVRAVRLNQEPVVVGPARRRVFTLEVAIRDATTACFTRDDTTWILGGALTDIRVGDRFVAEPPTSGRLEVVAVHHQLAQATADLPLTDGATVRPSAWGSPRAAVDVPADLPHRATVITRLTDTGRLTCTPSAELATLATLTATARGLEIRDPAGAVIRTGLGLDEACTWLGCMARVSTLRRHTTVAPLTHDDHAHELEWTRADPRQPLTAGMTLSADTRISARVHNRGRLPLYVTLFAAEAAGRITLLTRSQPAGVELTAGRTYNLGEDRYHGVRGVLLSTLPIPGPRRVALVAFVSSAGVPLGAWETSPLADIRSPAAPTATAAFPDHAVSYDVTVLDLLLAP